MVFFESIIFIIWGKVDLGGMFFGVKGEELYRRIKSKGMMVVINRILGVMWDVCWDMICE